MKMRDLCVQVENSRSVGKPGTAGLNINRTKTASSALSVRMNTFSLQHQINALCTPYYYKIGMHT